MVAIHINWIIVCKNLMSRKGDKWEEWIITLLEESSYLVGKNKKLITRRAFRWKLILRNVRNDVTNGYFCQILNRKQSCYDRPRTSTKYIWKLIERRSKICCYLF